MPTLCACAAKEVLPSRYERVQTNAAIREAPVRLEDIPPPLAAELCRAVIMAWQERVFCPQRMKAAQEQRVGSTRKIMAKHAVRAFALRKIRDLRPRHGGWCNVMPERN
jgi:hypothetical protein